MITIMTYIDSIYNSAHVPVICREEKMCSFDCDKLKKKSRFIFINYGKGKKSMPAEWSCNFGWTKRRISHIDL